MGPGTQAVGARCNGQHIAFYVSNRELGFRLVTQLAFTISSGPVDDGITCGTWIA